MNSVISMISVQKITKNFGEFKALDAISFEVEKGKIVGLLGPNGAGKTTTIRIIIGILPKTSGEISLNDKILDPKSREWKLQFGIDREERFHREENVERTEAAVKFLHGTITRSRCSFFR